MTQNITKQKKQQKQINKYKYMFDIYMYEYKDIH